MTLQGQVFFVVLGALLMAGGVRVMGATPATAIRVEVAVTGLYWIALHTIYIAGVWAGVFVL